MQPLLAHDSLPIKANRLLINYSTWLAPVVLLLLRLSLGYVTYLSGHRHLADVDAMVERFKGWGVPMPRLNVYISGYTEMIGGALLMLGLATRWVSIPLTFNFIVAIATAGREAITKDFRDGLLSGWETIVNDTAFPFLTFALVMLAFGAGPISIDFLLGRKRFCDHSNARRGFDVAGQ